MYCSLAGRPGPGVCFSASTPRGTQLSYPKQIELIAMEPGSWAPIYLPLLRVRSPRDGVRPVDSGTRRDVPAGYQLLLQERRHPFDDPCCVGCCRRRNGHESSAARFLGRRAGVLTALWSTEIFAYARRYLPDVQADIRVDPESHHAAVGLQEDPADRTR